MRGDNEVVRMGIYSLHRHRFAALAASAMEARVFKVDSVNTAFSVPLEGMIEFPVHWCA